MSESPSLNVDDKEIDKFSEIASRWWDIEGEFKPLHQINPLRSQYIQDACSGLFDKTVIDVGCGGGILSESLASVGAKVTGIDMAEASLEVAKLHGLESGIKVNYVQSTAEDFAKAQPEAFDVVACLEMLEHVPDPASVVNACAQMCKPDGKVVFSTLNRNLKSYAMAILGAEYVLGLVPKGTHEYKKFLKPSELLRFADASGLRPVAMTGLHFNPITNAYYLSDRNVDVNYIVVCEKIV